MTQITVDESLARQLRDQLGEIELRSPDGRILGAFRSEVARRAIDEGNRPTTAELERRRDEPGGRTLDEIVADLEAAG
jgi:hypothetical protein